MYEVDLNWQVQYMMISLFSFTKQNLLYFDGVEDEFSS